MRPTPTLSVVVPTHNRWRSLARLLAGLQRQTLDTSRLEVVVVADGCTDGTVPELQRETRPFALRVVELPGHGAAAARNAGAARATAPLLLFLDDDMEPTERLTEAHVRHHDRAACQVVIGSALPAWHGPAGFFRIALRHWWMDQFRALGARGHRFTFCDLLSGNFSVSAEVFRRAGGFDATLRCREDHELGVRLLAVGVSFEFAAEALAWHHDETDLDRSLARARAEGKADVALGARHPELRPVLEATSGRTRGALLQRLALHLPAVGDLVARTLRRMLGGLEHARLRRRWRGLYGALRGYWYWRGVGDAGGGMPAALSDPQPAFDDHTPAELDLDVSVGLAASERRLDLIRPATLQLRYGRYPIGRIGAEPGAERLRGGHLRPMLANQLAPSFLVALAAAEAGQPASRTPRPLQ